MKRLSAQGRHLMRWLMRHRLHPLEPEALCAPAVVFAPHEDDESLACGGTILKKRRAGASVAIVFMTDGGHSHGHLMPEKELAAQRAREAVAAGRALGVEEEAMAFLGFKDSKLGEQEDAAAERVKEIISERRPEQVFLPYEKDIHHDHLSTNRIVRAALAGYRETVVLYEYPVWFWAHWPWANVPLESRHKILHGAVRSLLCSWRLLRDFRCAVYVGDVLEAKRKALDQYHSQMSRLIPDPRWSILADFADGAFLECFFQENEIFRRSNYRASR